MGQKHGSLSATPLALLYTHAPLRPSEPTARSSSAAQASGLFSGSVARAGRRSGCACCISANRSLTLLLSSADRSGVSMSVPGAVKVMPETLDQTKRRLVEAWPD